MPNFPHVKVQHLETKNLSKWHWFRLCPSQRWNTPTNTRNNTHASVTFVTVAIIEKRLKARNGLHNIGIIAIKPHLMINKAIVMSSRKLSKREILFCLQCNATTEQCHYLVSCFVLKHKVTIVTTTHVPRNILSVRDLNKNLWSIAKTTAINEDYYIILLVYNQGC